MSCEHKLSLLLLLSLLSTNIDGSLKDQRMQMTEFMVFRWQSWRYVNEYPSLSLKHWHTDGSENDEGLTL